MTLTRTRRTEAPMTRRRGDLVFVHSSDELYGADRMLLSMLSALPSREGVEIWLPQDLEHPELSLCSLLEERGWVVRHLDLPILRRSYGTPTGLVQLMGRLR